MLQNYYFCSYKSTNDIPTDDLSIEWVRKNINFWDFWGLQICELFPKFPNNCKKDLPVEFIYLKSAEYMHKTKTYDHDAIVSVYCTKNVWK